MSVEFNQYNPYGYGARKRTCRHFLSGGCYHNDRCWYSHQIPSCSIWNILLEEIQKSRRESYEQLTALTTTIQQQQEIISSISIKLNQEIYRKNSQLSQNKSPPLSPLNTVKATKTGTASKIKKTKAKISAKQKQPQKQPQKKRKNPRKRQTQSKPKTIARKPKAGSSATACSPKGIKTRAEPLNEEGNKLLSEEKYNEVDQRHTEEINSPHNGNKARAELLKEKGNKLLKEGKYIEAEKKYTEAINLNPHNAVFYYNRCAALMNQGKYEPAIRDARKAYYIDPKYHKAYAREGLAEFESENYEKAHAAYRNAYIQGGLNKYIYRDDYKKRMDLCLEKLEEISCDPSDYESSD